MRVLLIEDNPGDARLVKETLKNAPGQVSIDVTGTLGDGLKYLASQPADVVLLDLNLPDSNGVETLTRLESRFPHLPIVIMTGSDDEAVGIQAVQLGAQDYLVKGQADDKVLRRALSYAIERKQAEAEMAYLATFPELDPNPIMEIDGDGNITYLNPSASALFSDLPVMGSYLTGLSSLIEDKSVATGARDVQVGESWYSQLISRVPSSQTIRIYGRDITERKQAEEELKESEERYRGVVENTTAIILRLTPEGVIAYANQRALDFFGYSAAELIGKHAVGSIVPHRETSGRDLAKMVDDIRANPEAFHTNANENICKDGRRVWLEWTNSGIYTPDGRLEGFLSVGIDATARKKAEEALLASEAKASALVKYAPTGIYEIDYSGPRFLTVNDAMCAISGYTREELLAMNPAQILDEDSRKVFAERIRRQLAGQKIDETVEYRVRKKGGSLIYATLNVAFSKHQPHTALVIAHDVTERRKAEEALLQEKRVRDAILENAGAMLVYLDRDFNFIMANQAYVKSCRHTLEELAGKNHFTLFPNAENETIFRKVRDTGEAVSFRDKPFEYTDQPERGITYWDWTLVPVKDAEGRVSGLVFSLIDTTERKKTDMLKDQFISMVSHELKTPLTVIIGALNTAMKIGISDEQAKDLVQDAVGSADSLAGIVENLLELSRSQAGRLVLHPQPVDVREIAREVVVKLQNMSSLHVLLVEMPEDMPLAVVDPVRIERILNNLVENAIKYSPDGGEIRVSARRQDDRLVVSVKDQGPGISAENQKKLFQSFEQLGMGTRRAAQGVGLGLKVCRSLVEVHGGRIWCDSEPGKGAAFSFTLPVSDRATR